MERITGIDNDVWSTSYL